jgi:hypothetical protein
MIFEAVKRFLNGETYTISDLYPEAENNVKAFMNFNWDPRLYTVAS